VVTLLRMLPAPIRANSCLLPRVRLLEARRLLDRHSPSTQLVEHRLRRGLQLSDVVKAFPKLLVPLAVELLLRLSLTQHLVGSIPALASLSVVLSDPCEPLCGPLSLV